MVVSLNLVRADRIPDGVSLNLVCDLGISRMPSQTRCGLGRTDWPQRPLLCPERAWPALVRAATFESMAARADQLIPAPGLFKNNAAFFRGAPPAPGSILTDTELASYHARVAGMAPADMLAWLHSPRPPRSGDRDAVTATAPRAT